MNFLMKFVTYLTCCADSYYGLLITGGQVAGSEIKRQKFVKLAEGRTQAALTALRKIGNLSNRRAYSYSDADVKKIMKVLRDALSETERKFGSSSDQPDRFKL
jgi:DNA polymerase elongation subunit (family B)